ncbi:MAG: hypothetical protein WAM70_09750, partial [Pyrinomonadaceae bacterium]
ISGATAGCEHPTKKATNLTPCRGKIKSLHNRFHLRHLVETEPSHAHGVVDEKRKSLLYNDAQRRAFN